MLQTPILIPQPSALVWLMCPLFPKLHPPFLLPTMAFSSPCHGFEGKLTFPFEASLDLALREALPGHPLPRTVPEGATWLYSSSL